MPFLPNSFNPQNFQLYQYQGSLGSVTGEISSIKSMLTSMMYKLDKLESMEKSIEELSTSITFINDSVEEKKAENSKLRDEIEKLQDRVIDVQSRTMHNNLIFYNMEEAEDYQNKENIVSSEKILEAFLKDKLNYKGEIILERAHQIGRVRISPNGRRMSCPLVAKFLSCKKKDKIRRNAKLLIETNYFISEQFPKEVMERCKQNIPVMKKAIEEGEKSETCCR